jgi:hypothetical protein
MPIALSIFAMPRNCFYSLSYNFFEAPVIGGISASVIVYATAAVITVGLYGTGWFRRGRDGSRRTLAQSVLMSLWVMWFGLVGMQTWHQRWFERRVDEKLGVLTNDQKYLRMYRYSYEAARAFTALVPSGSSARLVLGPSAGNLIEWDVMMYFLFPHLDTVHRVENPEYLIYYAHTPQPPPAGFAPVMIDPHNETSLWKRAGS